MSVSKSNALANLDVGDITSDLTNHTDTLVAQNHSRLQKVLICTAKTGVSGLNVDFIVLKSAGGLIRNDLSLLRSTENFESDAHYGGESWR
jgi:hypothetical protein